MKQRKLRYPYAMDVHRAYPKLLFTGLILCVALFAGCSQAVSPGGSSSEDDVLVFDNLNDTSMPDPRSAKIAGSTETVDDDGVVHGTTPEGVDYVIYGRGTSGTDPGKVTFAAVGDVLGTVSNFPITDRYAGGSGDGQYSFLPYYQATKDEILAHDITFINQETVCAGADRGYSGYPVFNSPDATIEAIGELGFSIVNFNSNHTWDMGASGVERSQGLFAAYPEMMLLGSYPTQEARDTVHMVERNGTTFAFLSYIYGDNNYGRSLPNDYYACVFDKDVMREEIARAKSCADVVIVYMHWGTEYDYHPDSEQEEYARFLADQDVDLVIGSHAHILQPIRFVTGDAGITVPVVYGLSDFISGWTLTDTILSGMFSCDFVWDGDEVVVENLQFTPAIEWSDGGDVYVRFLKDMSESEIANNTRTEDVGDDVSYLHRFIDDLGMDVPVVW